MRTVGKTVLMLCAAAMLLSVTVFDPSEITSKILVRFVGTAPQRVEEEQEVVADTQLQSLLRSIREDRVREKLGRFASMGSRVVGYPGCEEAYEFVRGCFEEIGLEDIATETFDVTVPVDKGAQLTFLDSAPRTPDHSPLTTPLYGLWPNGVRTPSLPTEGIEGDLVYGGRGTFAELDGKPMRGNVVVLSFDCGQNFVNPRMLGAEAIIFYGDQGVSQGEALEKFLKVSVDVPRFWVESEDADEVVRLAREGGHRVRVNGRMDWETVEAKNIYGWIRGDGSEKDAIVVEAYYDAMSVVPAVAPGAENACGIVGLLSLAERLKEYGTRHPVLFLATSAHFEALSGVNDFLYRHARGKGHFRDRMPEEDRIDFRVFIGLDLSSQGDQVASFAMGTFYNSEWTTDNYQKNMMAPYAKKFSDYGAELFYGQRPEHPRHIDAVAPPKRTWKNFMPVRLGLDSEAVSFVGLPGMTLGTPNDIRERVDTPLDRMENINFAGLTRQVQTVTALLLRAANDEEFFVDSKLELRDQGHALDGEVYWFDRNVHFAVPKKPVPQAVVTYQQPGPNSAGGVRTLVATMTNSQGAFRFDIMRNKFSNKISAYQLDETGQITSAPDLGQEGDASYPITQPYGWWENHMLEVLFPCRAVSLFEIVDSRYLSVLDYLMVLGEDDAPPQSYGSEYVEKQSTAHYESTDLFKMARAILSPLVPTKQVHKWADTFPLETSRSIAHLTRLTGISRPTLHRLHGVLANQEPDLVLEYPHMFPRSCMKVRAARTFQDPATNTIRTDPTGSLESKLVTEAPTKTPRPKPQPLGQPSFTRVQDSSVPGPHVARPNPDHSAGKNYKDLLDKRNFADLLARNLSEADTDHDLGNLVRVGERLSKIMGWDQEVRIDLQVQLPSSSRQPRSALSLTSSGVTMKSSEKKIRSRRRTTAFWTRGIFAPASTRTQPAPNVESIARHTSAPFAMTTTRSSRRRSVRRRSEPAAKAVASLHRTARAPLATLANSTRLGPNVTS